MTYKHTTRHLFTILLMLLLGTFTSAPLVRAQKAAAAKAASSAGGPYEGIKVHGHWTIEVRSPHGSLVSRREFKNALTTTGGALLGRFLQRTHKPGEWTIQLGSETNHLNPCEVNIAGPVPCVIYEATNPVAANAGWGTFTALTVGSEGGPNTNSTVLAGAAKARKNGLIDYVATLLINSCPVDSQGACNGSGGGNEVFTRTTLPTPINVVAGQIIQVKVVISFS
jgi:hypothetical protein